jgi:F0F1-type ATP synthase membrane subunit b/b'
MYIMSDFLLITTLAELSNKKEFGFNGNFLEANVINIALLLSGVIYLGRNFLTSALETRQQKIVEVMQESEERLTQANERLKEAEKQLAEAKLAISKIKEEATKTSLKVKETILAQGKADIERLTNNGKANIETAELQIRRQIQEHITELALKRVSLQLKDYMTSENQVKIINSNISQLGGTL